MKNRRGRWKPPGTFNRTFKELKYIEASTSSVSSSSSFNRTFKELKYASLAQERVSLIFF